MLAFLVYRTGTVVVAGKEAGVAVLALALGFSKAAFISLLTRFTNPKTTETEAAFGSPPWQAERPAERPVRHE
jgi:hypothetical protein